MHLRDIEAIEAGQYEHHQRDRPELGVKREERVEGARHHGQDPEKIQKL